MTDWTKTPPNPELAALIAKAAGAPQTLAELEAQKRSFAGQTADRPGEITMAELRLLDAIRAGTMRAVPVDAGRERVIFEGSELVLDEVVTCGGAHLERMSDKHWFLEMTRADGSSFCVWFKGRTLRTEQRAAPVED